MFINQLLYMEFYITFENLSFIGIYPYKKVEEKI